MDFDFGKNSLKYIFIGLLVCFFVLLAISDKLNQDRAINMSAEIMDSINVNDSSSNNKLECIKYCSFHFKNQFSYMQQCYEMCKTL